MLLKKLDIGLIFAAVLALFAIQALLQPGLPVSADLTIHLYRTLEFENAWAPGVIVPRWAPNLAYGYGYPLFVFAPPLPYAVATVLHLTGLSLEMAFKLLLIFTVLLYAVGMYLLARTVLRSTTAALVSAVAFTFAPFALRELLLYGGNVPQYLAIAFFPWTLWAATKAVNSNKWGWIALTAIFYTAIMLSHLYQALIFSPVLGLYLLLLLAFRYKFIVDTYPGWSQRLWTMIKPLLAVPLGLMLSAFFWIPAFTERYATRAQADVYLEKSPFFIRYPYWPELIAWIQPLDTRAANPYVPLTLGVVTLVLAGLGVLAAVVTLVRGQGSGVRNQVTAVQKEGTQHIMPTGYATRNTNPKSHILHPRAQITQPKPQNSEPGTLNPELTSPLTILFFAAVAAAATFMSLPASRQVWEVVSILQVAEFPWRMLGLANLGLAILAGAALLLVPHKFRGVVAALVIAILLVAIGPYLYPTIAFTRHGNPTIANLINYELSSQSIGTTTLGEYLPQSVTTPPTTSPLVDTYKSGVFPERLDFANLPVDTQVQLLEQTATTHRYQFDSPTPFTARFLQFNYPGWQVELNDRPVPIITEEDTGLILVDVPAGQHTLTLHFGETPTRLVAFSLTALALIVLAVMAVVANRSRHRHPAAEIQHSPAGKTQQIATRKRLLPALAGILLIAAVALWLMPLLKPIFIVNSPPEQALLAQHQTDIRFANGIQLIGYDIAQQVVQPGGYTQIVLYWQTNSAPYRVNLQPFVHLDRLDTLTTVADATNYTPGDVTTETNMPTFHWDNARYVRDEHDLIIPLDTLPMAYAVRVGLIDPEQNNALIPLANGSDDTAKIGLINVSPSNNQTIALEQALDVQFSGSGDTIQLTGFELGSIGPEQLNFNLTWYSTQRPQTDYTIFSQLLDTNHNLVTSFDRPPLDGAYPTSTWLPNQSILDPRILPLTDVPPGNYTLIIGLYNPATGHRLITNNGADFAELTHVTISN